MTLQSIKINKYIYKFLSTNEKLKKIVGNNIFPLIANEQTQFPFIVFSRTSVYAEYCKDGSTEDTVTIDVVCVSDDYTTSIEMAQCVREILENLRYKDENIYINECRIEGIEEYTQDYSFIQELTFRLKIQ